MASHHVQYEMLLAQYCNPLDAIALLREYRPYFELIPSLRRPTESMISLPLPVVKLDRPRDGQLHHTLTCDLALIFCDPEWRVKTGKEIVIFIHRPGEDFSDLLKRWRQLEVMLGYEFFWLFPQKYQHFFGEKGENHYPLFVTLDYTPDRIRRGLVGASLPFVSVQVKMPEEALLESARTSAATELDGDEGDSEGPLELAE